MNKDGVKNSPKKSFGLVLYKFEYSKNAEYIIQNIKKDKYGVIPYTTAFIVLSLWFMILLILLFKL